MMSIWYTQVLPIVYENDQESECVVCVVQGLGMCVGILKI
jgi:hypothetical protein